MPTLSSLDLSANDVGDRGAIAILRTVELATRGTRGTRDGHSLATAFHGGVTGGPSSNGPMSLRLLKLCSNPIGDGALDALLALVRCNSRPDDSATSAGLPRALCLTFQGVPGRSLPFRGLPLAFQLRPSS